ncbi:hypothetical protein A6A04_04620 [Paramagnetospirillum marisnigri]|uniref:Uncharacterized protein n=1 Tax=Paramagnetospirillum marisnigri TaxID=1285242 RepID=A0A178MIQ0_9PROT|nr:hypothetical protein [Paramagnetospirillum marisnigri]OAN48047.1 hypothetical protein A6A04_04620 [Paramagnetospirillum marisnigri]
MAYFEDMPNLPQRSIFTPSVSTTYFDKVSRKRTEIRQENIPPRLKSMEQLWWWNKGGETRPFFHYPYFMYSAGHAELDLTKAATKEAALFKRDRSSSVLITDSGGYQVAKIPDFFDWDSPEKIDKKRERLFTWIDAVADYSLSLDAPTFGASADHKALKTPADCLAFTLENLAFYESRPNKNENVRFLHAIHGSTIDDQTKWYEAVKRYRHYGWAFGASTEETPFRNLKNLLRMLMFLKQEGALEHSPHVHVLGIGVSAAAVMYSYIQIMIRRSGIPKFQITFDVSTAFRKAGESGLLFTDFERSILGPNLETTRKAVVPKTGWEDWDLPMGHDDLPKQLDFESPVFGYAEDKDRIMPKHLQPWSDGISLSLMMAQNLWLQTEMYKDAHDRFFVALERLPVERSLSDQMLNRLLMRVANHFDQHKELQSIQEDVWTMMYLIHAEGIMPPGWRRGDRGMSLEYFMAIKSMIDEVFDAKNPFAVLDKYEAELSSYLGGMLVS